MFEAKSSGSGSVTFLRWGSRPALKRSLRRGAKFVYEERLVAMAGLVMSRDEDGGTVGVAEKTMALGGFSGVLERGRRQYV